MPLMALDVSLGLVMRRVLLACDLVPKVAMDHCGMTKCQWSRMCDETYPADLRKLRSLPEDALAELLAQLTTEWLSPQGYRAFRLAHAGARLRMAKAQLQLHERKLA